MSMKKSLTSCCLSRRFHSFSHCRLYCHRHPRGSLHTRLGVKSFGQVLPTQYQPTMFQGKDGKKTVWFPIFIELFGKICRRSCWIMLAFQGFVSLRWIGATLVIVAGVVCWRFVLLLALSVAIKQLYCVLCCKNYILYECLLVSSVSSYRFFPAVWVLIDYCPQSLHWWKKSYNRLLDFTQMASVD